jgi:hypothetical protein
MDWLERSRTHTTPLVLFGRLMLRPMPVSVLLLLRPSLEVKKKKIAKDYHTQGSHVVTYRSTGWAVRRLSSLIGREEELTASYGGNRGLRPCAWVLEGSKACSQPRERSGISSRQHRGSLLPRLVPRPLPGAGTLAGKTHFFRRSPPPVPHHPTRFSFRGMFPC